MNISLFISEISKVAAIHGVSIGTESDKSTWRVDFKNEATEAQKQAAQAVIDNWIDIPEKTISCLEFWKKLTIQEQTDLETNIKMQTKLYLSAWNKSQILDYNDPLFIESMNYFVQEGLLTESRKQELLND